MPSSSAATPTTPNPKSSAPVIFILITVALDLVAMGIIAPVLPDLIKGFEGGNVARASVLIGYFAFAWATMQFLFSPVLGALSDRFGRRPIILLSCLGLGLDYIFMAMAPSLAWLFVGRIISGITTSNISTAFAYITDITPPEKRAKQFGLIGAAFGLGFVIGPAIGGLLGSHNLRLPFWVAAGLSLANTLYGFFILPESLAPERRAKSAWHMANPLGSLTLLRSHRDLSGLASALTIFYLAHNALPTVFVIYTQYRYGWNERQVGFSLAVIGVCAALVSGGLVGPYVKKFGERFSVLSGLCYGVLGFLGFALAWRGWFLLASIPLIALWGVAGPAIQSLMSRRVDHTSQGKLQGAINSLRSITGMVAPLIFTQVFAYSISARTALHLPGAPYFLSAVLLTTSLLVAAYVTRGMGRSPAARPVVSPEPATPDPTA
ncbi:MAG TPA: TCR/Tet family MFS transporter [Candidatus Dormibacteraeota bacterium]|nr:TCR/Tet family MFS transporter [Candidatus Dormibacteraeota bacterium]